MRSRETLRRRIGHGKRLGTTQSADEDDPVVTSPQPNDLQLTNALAGWLARQRELPVRTWRGTGRAGCSAAIS